MKRERFHLLIIALLAVIVYGNTLTLKYASDDRMVILESKSTIEGGWKGIKSIFTEDTFTSYFGSGRSIVAGGRYRPMSHLTYLIEFQLFGRDIKEKIGDVEDFQTLHDSRNEQYFSNSMLPVVNHLFNVLYYTLLCLLVYKVLAKLFSRYEGKSRFCSLAFIATLLFALHPIHTEAVANIKGRDEIFAMLGAMLALWCSMKYVDRHRLAYIAGNFAAMLFALFSKENAITFLAVIPLTLYFYGAESKRKTDCFFTLLPAVTATIIFLVVRSQVLGGFMPKEQTQNILNNPFAFSTKAQEIATVLVTWGIYFRLLVFPHPLTHDYYPHQIAITDFSNPLVWAILLCCVALVAYTLLSLKKKGVVAYALAFFMITFSITSNLLFNVGTFMNERFLFMPSLGFALLAGYLFYRIAASSSVALRRAGWAALCCVCVLYGAKTFTRNFVWHDDFTLFITDVKTSDKSIKCNISAGGSYLQMWKKSHKAYDKEMAYKYLQKALQLDKHAVNAYLLLGELMFLDGDLDGSLAAYRNVTLIEPDNQLAEDNIRKVMLKREDNAVQHINDMLNEGMEKQDAALIGKAYREICRYVDQHPESIVAVNVKANVLGRGMGQLDEAIALYRQIVEKDSNFASAYENMGIAYAIKRDFGKAEQCLLHALKLLPYNDNIKTNLYFLYQDMGETEKAQAIKPQ
jgi:protein O-mannosyl-transferase